MTNDLTRTSESLPAAAPAPEFRPVAVPAVDIVETPDEYRVTADLPGCAPDGIDVTFEGGTLTIHGRPAGRAGAPAAMLVEEFGPCEYQRSFNVTESIEASAIAAECSDGVLRLRLPKAESSKPRRIEVKSA